MNLLVLLILSFLLSCSHQSVKPQSCLKFSKEPSVRWFKESKVKKYQDVIEQIQGNVLSISKIKITDSQIDLLEQLNSLGFTKNEFFLKVNGKIKRNKKGEKLPLWIYEHPDGGVVRVKIRQDFSNVYHPYPHYIITSKFEKCLGSGFECETIKLGKLKNIYPKHPSDFRLNTTTEDLKCWGRQTHIRLRN